MAACFHGPILTLCTNAREPYFAIFASATVEVLPFSPSSRLAGRIGEYKRLEETPRGGAGGVR